MKRNELQNCLTEARQQNSAANAAACDLAADLLRAGRFIVVSESPVYCRATDALAGTRLRVLADFATRDEAAAAAAAEAEAADPDDRVYALPRAQVAPVAADDELPF